MINRLNTRNDGVPRGSGGKGLRIRSSEGLHSLCSQLLRHDQYVLLICREAACEGVVRVRLGALEATHGFSEDDRAVDEVQWGFKVYVFLDFIFVPV